MYATISLNSHQISHIIHAQQTKIGRLPTCSSICHLGNHQTPLPPPTHTWTWSMNPKTWFCFLKISRKIAHVSYACVIWRVFLFLHLVLLKFMSSNWCCIMMKHQQKALKKSLGLVMVVGSECLLILRWIHSLPESPPPQNCVDFGV